MGTTYYNGTSTSTTTATMPTPYVCASGSSWTGANWAAYEEPKEIIIDKMFEMSIKTEDGVNIGDTIEEMKKRLDELKEKLILDKLGEVKIK